MIMKHELVQLLINTYYLIEETHWLITGILRKGAFSFLQISTSLRSTRFSCTQADGADNT